MTMLSVAARVSAAVSVAACCLTAGPAAGGPATETLTVPGFGNVSIYAPRAAPAQVVLFVSGDGGWNLGVVPMAEALRDRGALVIGIDIRAFVKTLSSQSSCAYPAGDLERLSMVVQRKRGLREYRAPILVGYSSGATLVYAALAAAPGETFAGGISLGFCPDLEISRPLCQQRGFTATRRRTGPGFDLAPNKQMRTPWMILQGDVDQVCAPAVTRAFAAAVPGGRIFTLPKVGHGFAVTRNWQPQFLAAYDAIARSSMGRLKTDTTSTPSIGAGPGAPDVRDLPLTEVPVPPSARSGTMAVILTGDGGWADLDKGLAAGFADRGVPSVGWNSLRYYWTPRTPDVAAADLARIVQHYVSAWGTKEVLVAGYSFGADVLPFLVNRLPPSILAHVRAVALLGMSPTADFEFRLSNWIAGPSHNSPYRTIPEAQRLAVAVLCLRGADEQDSACGQVRGSRIRSLEVGQGHHFSGQYAELAGRILDIRW